MSVFVTFVLFIENLRFFKTGCVLSLIKANHHYALIIVLVNLQTEKHSIIYFSACIYLVLLYYQ